MRMPDIVRVVVLCAVYVMTGQLGLSLDAVSGFAAAVWPPTGIALAALVLYGCRLWPGLAMGAFLLNLLAGAPVLVASGMALGNTLEAVCGAVLLQRVVGFRPSLERLRDVLGLVVLAAGLSTLVSASIGVTSGWLGGVIPTAMYWEAWRTWWLGDALGDLVIAPLLLVWSRGGSVALPRGWVAEAFVLLVVVSVLSLAVFGNLLAPTPLDFPYLVFPVLIWVAMRLGLRGAVSAIALVSVTAIWGITQGVGPFGAPTLHEELLLVQAYMSIVALTVLVIAAMAAERRSAEEARARLAAIVESSQDAIIGKTLDGIITSWNLGAERLYGYTAAQAIGQPITLLVPSERWPAFPAMLARLARGEAIDSYETTWVRQDGQPLTVSLTMSPIRDPAGVIIGASTIARDITAREQAEAERRHVEAQLTVSLQEKEVLLKEIHHRVKNNLQIISSLLSLQSDAIADPRLLAQFQDSQDRVRSMALVHETLYQSQDLARLDMAPYIHTLSAQLAQSYNVDPARITVQIKVERLLLDLDQAIPCGLILSELLTNAFKYAFPASCTGTVDVELCSSMPQQARLVVRDTGIGLPTEVDVYQTDTLGLQLVGMLSEQLGGTIALERVGGTCFTLTFPVLPPEA